MSLILEFAATASVLNAAANTNFVADYISGWETAAIICVIIGLALMIVEMLTPGLGIAGIGGALALIAAIVLRADSWENALITLAIIIILLVIAGIIIFTSFNRGRISRSAIMLNDSITGKSTSLSSEEAQDLVGLVGVCMNDLRPAGYADFDGKRIDVVAQGEFISRGTTVKIVSVDGIKVNVIKIDFTPDNAAEISDTDNGGDDATL